jgi:hypothetical protein
LTKGFLILAALLVAPLTGLDATEPAKPTKPNILVIVAGTGRSWLGMSA